VNKTSEDDERLATVAPSSPNAPADTRRSVRLSGSACGASAAHYTPSYALLHRRLPKTPFIRWVDAGLTRSRLIDIGLIDADE